MWGSGFADKVHVTRTRPDKERLVAKALAVH